MEVLPIEKLNPVVERANKKANKCDGVAPNGDKGMDVDGEAMTAEGHGRLMEMLYDAREGWHVPDARPLGDFLVFLRGDHEEGGW